MKTQLLARWSGFSDKEKHISMALALIIFCLLLYTFVWLPVQQGRERFTKSIPEKQAKLLLMRAQAAEIEQLRSQFKSVRSSASGLKAAVEVSAKFHGLSPTYPDAAKGNDITQLNVALTSVSFNAWVKWAESLLNQNHVRIQSCQLIPTGADGQVKVEAVLTASE